MKILKVPQSEVGQAWMAAHPLLVKANIPGYEMDEEDVIANLYSGKMQLWVGEGLTFACITMLREIDGKKYAQIYMLSGTRIRQWYLDLYLFLYSWARAQQAQYLEIDYPRPGWKRLLSSLGFTYRDEDTLVKEIVQ